MSIEDFEFAKDSLISMGIKDIQFIGGEPMLHPKLKEMIIISRPHFNFIEVYTNGTFITQEWCDFFLKYDIKVALSIHSYIAKEHDKITQVTGSHCRVDKAINLLIKNNITYRLAAIANDKVSMGKKPSDCKYTIHESPPRLAGRCSIKQYNLEMFKSRAITENNFKHHLNKAFVIKIVSGHQCFDKNLYIAWNLEVFPCVMERRFSYGNMKDGVIHNELSKLYSKDCIEGCKDCEFRYDCYDCRPDSGNRPLLAKPWYCTYDQNIGIFDNTNEFFKKLHVS